MRLDATREAWLSDVGAGEELRAHVRRRGDRVLTRLRGGEGRLLPVSEASPPVIIARAEGDDPGMDAAGQDDKLVQARRPGRDPSRLPMIRATLLALLAAPGIAAAQDGPRLAFTIGAGASAVPEYFGSDRMDVGPSFSVDVGFLSFGPLAVGDEDPTDVETGWGVRGSFRYVSARQGGPFEGPGRLAEEVDAAVELGGGVSYAQSWYEAFAVARVGVGGHDAVVGEVGLDLIARPTDRLRLSAGPRLFYGTDDYAGTYFSTAEDTDAAGPAFEAEGGFLTSGVEVGASYDLTDRWGLEATARYDRFQGDAEESPITEEDDQVSATIEITRRFDFRF